MTKRSSFSVPDPKPRIGLPIDDVDTPSLILDLDAFDRNLQKMMRFCRERCVNLRPHAKTHKSSRIAQMQMAAGAIGICVQKTAEAEAMAKGGVHDIYISNEVVSAAKLDRIARLNHHLHANGGRLAIAVDSLHGTAALSRAMRESQYPIDVFIEIDVGHGRCGVAVGAQLVELASHVVADKKLRFAGLQAFHGKAQHQRSIAERESTARNTAQTIRFASNLLEAAGIPCRYVTGSGTGAFGSEITASAGFHELQAGSFIFMDADYAKNEVDSNLPIFEHALFVKTQIMSRGENHAVCDAGHKSHAVDSGMPRVWEASGLEYRAGSDEHGVIHSIQRDCPLPGLGDFLYLVPGHCDPTVNLHDSIIGVRNPGGRGLRGARVSEIIDVDARGALT